MDSNHPNRFNQPPPLDGLANKAASRTVDNWVEAKNIYMSYLHDVLVPIVYDTMYSVYRDAVNLTESQQPEDVERTFMDFLVETKVWSLPIIEGETANILKYCPWFNKLLKGVFVSNVMVLSSAQLNRQNAPAGKVRLHIPQCQVFVQALYANVAARLFNHPNIFRTVGLTSDQLIDRRNLAYREIENAIDATVRGLLPIPQVIESSMNFTGNNPVITARPPPPTPAHQRVPTTAGRVSARATEKRENFVQKPRLTPPAPPPTLPHSSREKSARKSTISFKAPPPVVAANVNEFRQSALPPAAGTRISFAREARIPSQDVRSVQAQLDMNEDSKDSSSSSSSSSDEEKYRSSEQKYRSSEQKYRSSSSQEKKKYSSSESSLGDDVYV